MNNALLWSSVERSIPVFRDGWIPSSQFPIWLNVPTNECMQCFQLCQNKEEKNPLPIHSAARPIKMSFIMFLDRMLKRKIKRSYKSNDSYECNVESLENKTYWTSESKRRKQKAVNRHDSQLFPPYKLETIIEKLQLNGNRATVARPIKLAKRLLNRCNLLLFSQKGTIRPNSPQSRVAVLCI